MTSVCTTGRHRLCSWGLVAAAALLAVLVLFGILVGSCLGAAGAMMLALTRNPLAEPGILGVNAGAAVAISMAIAFFGVSSVLGYMWFGMAGAAVAGISVYLLGGLRTGTNPVQKPSGQPPVNLLASSTGRRSAWLRCRKVVAGPSSRGCRSARPRPRTRQERWEPLLSAGRLPGA